MRQRCYNCRDYFELRPRDSRPYCSQVCYELAKKKLIKSKEPKKKNPCRECGKEMDGRYFFQERQHKTCQKCNAKYGKNARKPKEENQK